MIYLSLNTFIGRFHPLVVHLPIGFLLLGIFFLVLSSAERFASLKPAVVFSFAAGALASVIAIITGYFLSGSGDYDEELLASHQVMGYVTALIAFAAWLLFRQSAFAFHTNERLKWISAIVILCIVSYTGHLGGSLTHGEGYLSFDEDAGRNRQRTKDFKQALVFRDLVQPILEDKCGSCHNASKKKGRLSFASIESLLKGGKHGPVIKSGDPEASEMIKRTRLPASDKKFMPADDKPPLNSSESRILSWWIREGVTSKDKKLAEVKLPENIKADVVQFFEPVDTLQNVSKGEIALGSQFSVQHLPTIPSNALHDLSKKGFQVRVIHYNPDLLDIRMDAQPVSAQLSFKERIGVLMPLKLHIIWLDLKESGLTDGDMVLLNEFRNLHKLNLAYNSITDQGIQSLRSLDYLQSINLTGTMITERSLTAMKFRDLKAVYAWRSGVTKTDSASLAAYSFRVVAGPN